MRQDVVEQKAWVVPEADCVHLFVDARGVPPRCSAVLVADGACQYTDGLPSSTIMASFYQRKDNQIMSLEISEMLEKCIQQFKGYE